MSVHGAKSEKQVTGLRGTSAIMIINHRYKLKSRQVITFWVANMFSISLKKAHKAWVQCGFKCRNLTHFVKEFRPFR